MKIFLDTAQIDDIKTWMPTHMVDGVTTNPSLIAKSGQDIKEVIREICNLVPNGPVSAEVTAQDYETMMKEAEILRKLGDNVAIKVPLTVDGLRACHALSHDGTLVNVTLCFTSNQALLAAKSGAAFISPFMGRLDDLSDDGFDLIQDIVTVLDQYPQFQTEVLAASIRSPLHIKQASQLGADIVTIPPKLLKAMYTHPKTDEGLTQFTKDWAATGRSIL